MWAFKNFPRYYFLASWWSHCVAQCIFLFRCCFDWLNNLSLSKVVTVVICFKEMFLWKVIMSFVLPNMFLKVLLIFKMCHCLFITSLEFGGGRFYVAGKKFMSAWIGLCLPEVIFCQDCQLCWFGCGCKHFVTSIFKLF